jgi:hypothetical protein
LEESHGRQPHVLDLFATICLAACDTQENDIHICVVNTRKIARGSILPASILMIYFGIETVGTYNYTPKGLRDEYLSQGTVDIYAKSPSCPLCFTSLGEVLISDSPIPIRNTWST